MSNLSHLRLQELLDYNPLTGVFTRKVSLSPATKVGDIAGNLNKGYVELFVDGRLYRAHNLAWYYVHGTWPIKRLDHHDLDKANNAIANLREATNSQNGGNNRIRLKNLTGFKGVTPYRERFKAAVMVNRKRIHLGVFTTPEQAAAAYDIAAVHHFGEFALTNHQLGRI